MVNDYNTLTDVLKKSTEKFEMANTANSANATAQKGAYADGHDLSPLFHDQARHRCGHDDIALVPKNWIMCQALCHPMKGVGHLATLKIRQNTGSTAIISYRFLHNFR